MRRRSILTGLAGLAAVPQSAIAQELGNACRPDPAEQRGSFVVRFGDGAHNLWFAATRHSMTLGSQSFLTVSSAMDQAKPSYVIVEGLDTSLGENFDADKLRSLGETDFQGGEARYASMLSAKRDIPYLGGEVAATAVNDALLRTFSLQEIIKAYLSRDVYNFARLRPFKSGAELLAFVRQAADRLAVSDGRLWDKALADGTWFLEANGLPDRTTSPDAGTPCGADQTDHIIEKITEIRNLHLYRLILSKAKNNASTLVVYGSGHLRVLRPGFERALGPAQLMPSGREA